MAIWDGSSPTRIALPGLLVAVLIGVTVPELSLTTYAVLPSGVIALVSCWLCGIRLHQIQMVPDGGSACADLRWYCQDTRACTECWTSAQSQRRAAEAAPPREGHGLQSSTNEPQ